MRRPDCAGTAGTERRLYQIPAEKEATTRETTRMASVGLVIELAGAAS